MSGELHRHRNSFEALTKSTTVSLHWEEIVFTTTEDGLDLGSHWQA